MLKWLLVLLLLLGITALVLKKSGYGIVYQGSPSMPQGFYWKMPITAIKRNTIVLFNPPPAVRHYMQARGWLGSHVPMMKYAMGLPGDKVCIRKQAIYINGQWTAPIYREYRPGKQLPQIRLCQTLRASQYLLLSTYNPHSFDSRYFGVVMRSNIIAKAAKMVPNLVIPDE